MRNSEEAIDKVLAGLRDAEAPAGMERRILDGLEERAAAGSRSGWRRLLPVWLVAPASPVATGALVGGVALAGLFAVALAIPAIRRLGHAPVPSKRNSAAAGTPALAASQVAAKSAQPASPRSGARSLGKMKEETTAGGAVLDSDSVALEEMHAASYPAPPMPLTEQERLLLRIVHKDDPVELAMLDPKLRALQDSEDKAEFQRFFGQSTKQPAPDPSMTEQAAPLQATTEQSTPEQSTTEQSTTEQSTTEQSTTEQATPAQPGTQQSTPEQPVQEQPVQEQPVPEQPVQEQPVQEQPTQPQSTPERLAPDQSTMQQARSKPTRTGENE
jgi:hypothetical protein